jgi:hypothetical protein
MTGRRGATALLTVGLVLTCSCAATKVDYTPYRTHMPHSILVLPPRNESTNVTAPYVYLSTASRPLAECGYYVFPVAVIDAFMKDNGLPTPDEMHGVSLNKIKEVIGADAVLYVTIEDWGQKYVILSSTTVVKARARLVDVATGTEIWSGTEQLAQGSGGAENGIIGMLVTALVQQIAASLTDPTHEVSRQATNLMVFNANTGLLFGPHHPEYDSDLRGR